MDGQPGISECMGRDVAEAQTGDHAAFGRLYDRMHVKVRNSAYRVTRDLHEAEDTAQDAFLSAYLCLPRLSDPGHFEAWLMCITRNRAVDRRRGMLKCRPSERAHDDASDAAPELPKVLRRSGVREPNPESIASLRACVAGMTAAMRSVMSRRYVHGRSCEEIAREDGVSVMAVKTRLCRARRILREALTAGDPPAAARRPGLKSGEKTCVSVSRS